MARVLFTGNYAAFACLLFAHGLQAEAPGWLYYGGDQGGRHYSDAAQIDRKNVKNLEVAWISRNGDMDVYCAIC